MTTKPEPKATARDGGAPKESRTARIARQANVVNICLNLADRGLRRCNAALEALQPRQPGRITLLEMRRETVSKTPLNDVRWRLVRWRIRRQNNDGSVEWQAVLLPLRGASRMASGKFGFHDTQAEVRAAIRAAVELIEWRGRVVKLAANFVTGDGGAEPVGHSGGDEAHRSGRWRQPSAGQQKRAAIKAAAEQLGAGQAA